MTIHYHAADVNPISKFMELIGCNFCVSFARTQPTERAHRYGQSVMLDNGAFSHWRLGSEPEWPRYLAWCDRWLDYPTTWAVIPDLIEGDMHQQQALIAQWPFGLRGSPVWHMHEPVDHLLALLDSWPRVCIGSSAQYAEVLSTAWRRRMDHTWNEVMKRHRRTPNIHGMRMMQLVNYEWPFASLDSSDIARNHNRPQNTPEEMARRWDQFQCVPKWHERRELELATEEGSS